MVWVDIFFFWLVCIWQLPSDRPTQAIASFLGQECLRWHECDGALSAKDADEIDNVKRLVLKAHSTEALSTEECFRYLQDGAR